jgi:hypothetical protein
MVSRKMQGLLPLDFAEKARLFQLVMVVQLCESQKLWWGEDATG